MSTTKSKAMKDTLRHSMSSSETDAVHISFCHFHVQPDIKPQASMCLHHSLISRLVFLECCKKKGIYGMKVATRTSLRLKS